MEVLTVGLGGRFTDLATAVCASNSGDEIHIVSPLEVVNVIRTNHPLSFVGIGSRPKLNFRGLSPIGAGILTTYGNTYVSNLEFSYARALTGNAAGLWHTGGKLQIVDCTFSNNQNGVMVAASIEDVADIIGCNFIANGAGCGHTHGIYATSVGRINVQKCSFEDTRVGHHLKSRASCTRVIENYFGSAPNSTTSYAIDISNGGEAKIISNLLIKGRGAMSRKFIAYCPEPRRYDQNNLEVRSNIFISHRRDLAIAIVNLAHFVSVQSEANAYEGRILPLVGRGRDNRRRQIGIAIARGAASDSA